jgi:hypothetical protein
LSLLLDMKSYAHSNVTIEFSPLQTRKTSKCLAKNQITQNSPYPNFPPLILIIMVRGHKFGAGKSE